MKRILVSSLTALTMLLGSSCSKTELPEAKTLSGKAPQGQQRVSGSCRYTKLNEISPGVYGVWYQGIYLTFSNLHIRNDGRLYGKLESSSAGIMLSGDVGTENRDFAVQSPSCTGGPGSVVKTITSVPYTQFVSNSGGNSSFAMIAGNQTLGGAFDIWLNNNLEAGVIYNVGQVNYRLTRYDWAFNPNCNVLQIVAGKLVAKNVSVVNNSSGVPVYTCTEYGIADYCYEDQQVPILIAE